MEVIGRDQIEVRLGEEADHPFVFSTLLKTYKHSSYFAKRIRDEIFFRFHHAIIESILSKPKVKLLIAHPKGDAHVILGYLLFDERMSPHIIHFAYVKKNFRGLGIANILLEESKLNPNECYFTHWCFDGDWLTRKFPDLTYNPYLL